MNKIIIAIVSVLVGGVLTFFGSQYIFGQNSLTIPDGQYKVKGNGWEKAVVKGDTAIITSKKRSVEYYLVSGTHNKTKIIAFQNVENSNTNLFKISKKNKQYEFCYIRKNKPSEVTFMFMKQ